MPLMDEFREEREKIKDAPMRAKMQYFADYYLKWVIAAAAVLIVVIILIVDMARHKEEMLYVMFANFRDLGRTEADIEDAFAAQYLEDPKKQRINAESDIYILADEEAESNSSTDAKLYEKYTYSDQQKVTMQLAVGGMDLMISGEDVLRRYVEYGYVIPLENLYSAEELKAFEEAGLLLTVDGKAMAICVDGSELLKNCLEYNGEKKDSMKIYAGFTSNRRTDMAKQFLEFLKYLQ
ncbi:MAG: hypothetical protein K6E50_09375 [Lachnospiraceae bacterium]|nr:hypothetical protein [Lachnospiraceae bacterium]